MPKACAVLGAVGHPLLFADAEPNGVVKSPLELLDAREDREGQPCVARSTKLGDALLSLVVVLRSHPYYGQSQEIVPDHGSPLS